MAKKFVCDHCGKEQEGAPEPVEAEVCAKSKDEIYKVKGITITRANWAVIDDLDPEEDLDLCEDCIYKIAHKAFSPAGREEHKKLEDSRCDRYFRLNRGY